ncbi:hypothetical protein IW262DRAFT_329893 [Armillaria fumosa]|nr:hypothetical protein IW262DRAFT_329893 [Armillaria fumosa]
MNGLAIPMDKFFQNRRRLRTSNNIPWRHTMDDFYWIRSLPDSDVKPIWTRSMLDEFGEKFGDEPPVTRVEPRRLTPWPLLKVPNNDSRFGLVDEMRNGDYSLKLRLFDAVQDAYSFAGFGEKKGRIIRGAGTGKRQCSCFELENPSSKEL